MLQKLKSLLATKSSATGALVTLHTAGRPQWTPRNYAALAREGFAGNVIGYRCVRMIAEAAASIPLLFYIEGNETETGRIQSLLARPNAAQTGRDFLDQLLAQLLLAGNAYAELVML